MAATHPIFTIGHSTKPIAAFVELLRVGKVASVVDIRSVSRSRANTQYNRDVLPAALASCQIGYEGLPELGGLRKTSKRSEEHTSELQSLMRISYAVFCLKKKTQTQ